MNKDLAVSYNTNLPVLGAIISAFSSVIYFIFCQMVGGLNWVYFINSLAMLVISAMLFFVAKKQSNWLALPIIAIGLSAFILTIFAVLSAIAGLLSTTQGILRLVFSAATYLSALTTAILFGLALIGKFDCKLVLKIMPITTTVFVVGEVVLGIIFGTFNPMFAFRFLGDIGFCAVMFMLAYSMQPKEFVEMFADNRPLTLGKQPISKVCPKCGKTTYNESDNYCSRCGSELVPTSNIELEIEQVYARVCPQCDYRTASEEMEFCVNCGTKLEPYNDQDYLAKINKTIATKKVTPKQAGEHLLQLRDLLKKGLIEQEEYDQKRSQLIKYL